MAEQEYASFNPEDGQDGGLWLDDTDIEIIKARFKMNDYDGKRTEDPVICLMADIKLANGKEFNNSWSLGAQVTKNYEISSDGKKLIYTGTNPKLRKDSQFLKLITSINIVTGDPSLIQNDISVLDGMKCHTINEQQEREFEGEGKKIISTILVDDISTASWMKGKSKKKKAASSKAAAKKENVDESQESNGLSPDDVAAVVLEKLVNADGELKVTKLPALCLADFKDKNTRGPALHMVSDKDGFLAVREEWEYDADEKVIRLA